MVAKTNPVILIVRPSLQPFFSLLRLVRAQSANQREIFVHSWTPGVKELTEIYKDIAY